MSLMVIISIGAVILFLIGTPIMVVIGLWCIGASIESGLSLANMGSMMFEGLNSFGLLAMPLFVLTGDLIMNAGIAKKLTDFAYACLSFIRGSQAMATIGACGFFAAISGSNAATAATIGSIMHPDLVKEGYDDKFAAATIAAGGVVGIIIPPSVLFIVYGFMTNISVADMFIGGIIPGILMVTAMTATAFFIARKHGWGRVEPLNIRNIIRAGCNAYLGFGAIGLIMYGIYTGKFSCTESAAVCVGYTVLAGLFITRELTLKTLPDLLFKSGKIVGMTCPLVAMSIVMQQCLTSLGIEDILASLLEGLGVTGFLFLSCLLIFICGMFLESTPCITILAPILAPIATSLGIHPVHFAVITMVGLAIGFITPPFGLNLFVASAVTGVYYVHIIRAAAVYVLVPLASCIVIIVAPWMSLALL